MSKSAAVLVVSSNPNQAAQNIPVKLGTSGGNANDSSIQGKLVYCCGGTLGSLLQRNGTFYILSNNHVLAQRFRSIGDAITQPDLIDANLLHPGTTTVGNLTQYVNLEASERMSMPPSPKSFLALSTPPAAFLGLGATATGGTPDPVRPMLAMALPLMSGKQ